MKLNLPILALLLLSLAVPRVFAQGFVNLNFEAAHLAGYSPGIASVPVANALPGWNAFFSNSSATDLVNQVSYNGISLGGAVISVIDSNAPSFTPLQGKYSAFLFGGPYQSPALFSAGISQTGVVPNGTESLQMDAYESGAAFVVLLGGQVITMAPIQSFSTYTLYGGVISPSLAGQDETLSIIEEPSAVTAPTMLELDNIRFSSSPVPEPGTLALAALGTILAGLGFRRKKSK